MQNDRFIITKTYGRKHSGGLIQTLNNSTFASAEVKGVKEVKEVKDECLGLNDFRKEAKRQMSFNFFNFLNFFNFAKLNKCET